MEKESVGRDGVASGDDAVEAAASKLSTISWDMTELGNSQARKDTFWHDGMVDCFSTILSIFGRKDDKTLPENNWEVPVNSLSEMHYIGSGAQGVVFSAMYKGELVAVKKLKEKTETNIKHLRKLNHENIVRFIGICSKPPFYCVIMEFCQCGPLFKFLHSGVTFSPKQILKWAKEIAQGMAYLHSHKIVHRDLKSPNILVGDGLVAKVSDFGTSRVWNDVSAIMSFTGTVAWMAPEIIRQECCSDKIDVWSYGVVLWELLTKEIPYKTIEAHAIMWGVGTNTLSLPIPPTFPESLQLLMKQCWNRVPRHRPSFKFIATHIDIAGKDLTSLHVIQFDATQAIWRKDVDKGLQEMYSRTENGGSGSCDGSSSGDGSCSGGCSGDSDGAEARRRQEEKRSVRDLQRVYEQQVSRANKLYMEVNAAKLQLEQRERIIANREKLLEAIGCRCSVAFRKSMKQMNRASSSSSDSVKELPAGFKHPLQEAATHRIRKKRHAHKQPVKTAVQNITNCEVNLFSNINNNNCSEKIICNTKEATCNTIVNNDINALNTSVEKLDTIIKCNGNVEVAIKSQPESVLLCHLNGDNIV